jgi:hypothetical protein
MMIGPDSHDLGSGLGGPVTAVSGCEPHNGDPLPAERILASWRERAQPDRRNTGPAGREVPPRVPGPGVDPFVAALLTSLRNALAGNEGAEGT